MTTFWRKFEAALYATSLLVFLVLSLPPNVASTDGDAMAPLDSVFESTTSEPNLLDSKSSSSRLETPAPDGLLESGLEPGTEDEFEIEGRSRGMEPSFLEDKEAAAGGTTGRGDESPETSTLVSVGPSQTSSRAAGAQASAFGNFATVIGLSTQRTVRMARANNDFAFALAKVLIKGSTQRNIFFSPLTLFSTLLTMYSGASGDTAAQMREALSIANLTEDEIVHGFRDVLHSLQKKDSAGDENSLKMLNALFVDKQSPVSTAFTDRTRTYFNAYLEKVDFGSEPGYVHDWVNKLVAWWTEGHIKTLLDEAPDALTKLLLVNAVFFRGKWAHTFEARFTSPELFTNSEGIRTPVEMMKRTERYHVFCDNATYHTCALELLYSGDALSFLVFMPASGHNLTELEESLSTQMMYSLISRLEERTLELGLPKFFLSTSYELPEPLKELGIRDAFLPSVADFSRMGTNLTDLFVSALTHKSVLEVSEEGTTAAGAAFASIGNRRKPRRLYVDRPFLFLVRDLKTDAILFLGRVMGLP